MSEQPKRIDPAIRKQLDWEMKAAFMNEPNVPNPVHEIVEIVDIAADSTETVVYDRDDPQLNGAKREEPSE